ncbi:MAG: metal ABC transporter permease [Patescibacteria group bacterium]
MLELLQYDFVVRGLIAGVIVAMIAPIIGIFLVLRRYSLIADTLAHVSLAGIAVGLLLKIDPIITAIVTTMGSSVLIEKMRSTKKVYGESALAIFLSGSLALAIVIISASGGLNANLFNYLFGSIVTVTWGNVWTMGALGAIVIATIMALYKSLLYLTFDEDSARVAGINHKVINTIFIALSALTISLAIPVVGIMLISALLVIPVVTALQFGKPFLATVVIAQIISIISVIGGIVLSFYLNLASGGTIVLITLAIFGLTLTRQRSG